jgi:hypothetical protein
VNPSAEGIVKRHTIFDDQGAAGRGGPEAAQADALRGGVSHQRAGAPEKLHAWNLPQLAVESDGGSSAKRTLRKGAGGDRALQLPQRRAISGDGNLLSCPRRLKADSG